MSAGSSARAPSPGGSGSASGGCVMNFAYGVAPASSVLPTRMTASDGYAPRIASMSCAKFWSASRSIEISALMRESLNRNSSSRRFDQVEKGTSTAPIAAAPKQISTHSAQLLSSSPTRSWRPRPSARKSARGDALRARAVAGRCSASSPRPPLRDPDNVRPARTRGRTTSCCRERAWSVPVPVYGRQPGDRRAKRRELRTLETAQVRRAQIRRLRTRGS